MSTDELSFAKQTEINYFCPLCKVIPINNKEEYILNNQEVCPDCYHSELAEHREKSLQNETFISKKPFLWIIPLLFLFVLAK